MRKFKLVQDDLFDIIDALVSSNGIDLSLIPDEPIIHYYDNEDKLFYSSKSEIDFYAIRLMIDCNNFKGYYFTVETEWWDNEDEYQGTNGDKHYKKYYFNNGDNHALSDCPKDLFSFSFNCLLASKKTKKNKKKMILIDV